MRQAIDTYNALESKRWKPTKFFRELHFQTNNQSRPKGTVTVQDSKWLFRRPSLCTSPKNPPPGFRHSPFFLNKVVPAMVHVTPSKTQPLPHCFIFFLEEKLQVKLQEELLGTKEAEGHKSLLLVLTVRGTTRMPFLSTKNQWRGY